MSCAVNGKHPGKCTIKAILNAERQVLAWVCAKGAVLQSGSKPALYELRSENLTHLGGPMGTEYTFDNWRKYYTSVDAAKRAAEHDFGRGSKEVKWHRTKYGWSTQDLGWVMYYIEQVKVEE